MQFFKLMKRSALQAAIVVLLFGNNLQLFTVTAQSTWSTHFTLELIPGNHYKSSTRWFIFKIPIYPQVAVWVENEEGQYFGTLFVTEKGGRNRWISAPVEGRPEALPVWNHIRQGGIDGISAATSKAKTVKECYLTEKLKSGKYVIKLETNRSYDYNNVYKKEISGVGGQPSLIYQAVLTTDGDSCSATFSVIGTGSKDGSDGEIHRSLSGIDTALELFSKMTITYRK